MNACNRNDVVVIFINDQLLRPRHDIIIEFCQANLALQLGEIGSIKHLDLLVAVPHLIYLIHRCQTVTISRRRAPQQLLAGRCLFGHGRGLSLQIEVCTS